jgi:hypothetical protein
MRCCLFILAICLGISVATVDASEVVLGVVNAVDREKGLVTLKVIDSSGDDGGSPQPESLSVTVNPDQIPDCVVPGNTIRIWGEYIGDEDNKSFRAASIRGGGVNSRRYDPTGVRSRMGRGYQGGRGDRMGGGKSSGRR